MEEGEGLVFLGCGFISGGWKFLEMDGDDDGDGWTIMGMYLMY